MDRGEVPTPAIPLKSVGWIRKGRGSRSVGRRSIISPYVRPVSNPGPVTTTNEKPLKMDAIGGPRSFPIETY
uniref:Uncharacterized protein n=1 Tax=Magallana gigas TaxID=29159 RepID=K1QLC7_MAGGI